MFTATSWCPTSLQSGSIIGDDRFFQSLACRCWQIDSAQLQWQGSLKLAKPFCTMVQIFVSISDVTMKRMRNQSWTGNQFIQFYSSTTALTGVQWLAKEDGVENVAITRYNRYIMISLIYYIYWICLALELGVGTTRKQQKLIFPFSSIQLEHDVWIMSLLCHNMIYICHMVLHLYICYLCENKCYNVAYVET